MHDNKQRGIKLIVCDLDGTLLADKYSMSGNARAVVQQLQEKPILFVPATGRHLNMCPWFQPDAITSKYVINNNGAVLNRYTPDRQAYHPIVELHFSYDLSHQFLTLARDYGLAAACVTNQRRSVTGNQLFFQNVQTLAENVTMRATCLTRRLAPTARVYQWTLWVPPARIDWVEKWVRQLTSCRVYVHSHRRALNLLEINPPTSDKWHMVQKICELEGIDPAEVMAIGNGLNDARMIKNSGVGVCPSNSPVQVLQLADITFDWNFSQGLVRFFAQYFFAAAD